LFSRLYSKGWAKFTSGWLVGGLSGVAWSYILTQILPYYQTLS
jgi:photosystem I subunit 11